MQVERRGEGTDLWNMSLVLNQLGEQALIIFEQIEDPNTVKICARLPPGASK
jgi:hypothetical protein